MLTDWRNAIAMPVVTKTAKWNCAELEVILTDSISHCAVACLRINNGVICTTLSGGLDSSFCLAKIREIMGYSIPIHTFTIGGSEEYPDVQFARIVSQKFKTVHHEIIPSKSVITKAEKKIRSQWEDDPCTPGDVAVYLTYREVARHGLSCVITHDGIDELLGGYWEHRKHERVKETEDAFKDLWGRLEQVHLLPLERKAFHFSVYIALPYLQKSVVEYIAKIPVMCRTSRKVSKRPLRNIAKKYLPVEVIDRKKKGFCSALDTE